MVKNNEIVVCQKNGMCMWKMLIVNKNNYINKKGNVPGRLLDIVAGAWGNVQDYLIELEQQECIVVETDGKNYLVNV
tara:strand:+ start:233 stop:463 length:231 start_codon:yes stop_codon:yes gene_type:complete